MIYNSKIIDLIIKKSSNQKIFKGKVKKMFSVSADIIVLALIAGVVLFRLYHVLGQKDNDGEFIQEKNVDLSNIIDISEQVKAEEVVNLTELEKDIAPAFNNVLEEVRKIDANFSLKKFLDGAKKAFEMILTAFAENDKEKLKLLLDDKIYQQFLKEIDKRTQNQVNLNLTLVSLPIVEIRDVKLVGRKISIDVFYNSQQITILKNQNNEIIEGNPSQIDNVEDIWRFEKELGGKQSWLLVNVNAG